MFSRCRGGVAVCLVCSSLLLWVWECNLERNLEMFDRGEIEAVDGDCGRGIWSVDGR